ncbi:MAG: RraA family protein [Thermaerobacter sp.]|nr:RraA family protein [Thermaerobacter sp.]
MSDEELFAVLEQQLYTAVISDVLDEMGYRDQVMAANLRPIGDRPLVVGRARTILAVDYYEPLDEPYGVELQFVDSLRPGDVVVAGTNQSVRNGLWGELLSTASQYRGARGAIIDGYVRDVRKIRNLGFPVWGTGTKPVDSAGRGKSIAHDCRVLCGGVYVRPGDIVFADDDGIVVIPSELVEEVVGKASVKVAAEDSTRSDLTAGMSLSEVFRRRGVL